MGPIRQKATKPKLSSSVVFITPDRSQPKAQGHDKGTIIGPVVTAPDSQAMERKFLLVKPDKIKASIAEGKDSSEPDLKQDAEKGATSAIPTPTETAKIMIEAGSR